MSTAVPAFDTGTDASAIRVAVVTAQWNGHITGRLRDGARQEAERAHAQADYYDVPGAVELVYAAARLRMTRRYQAVVILGCVIRGDTPHFDYVCDSVTTGMTALNLCGDCPVIFGLLTVDDERQALDRAGGAVGNKGAEAMLTALAMARLTAGMPVANDSQNG